MSTLVLFSTIVMFAGIALWRTHAKASRYAGLSWEQIVGRLEAVPFLGITEIAEDYLQPRSGQIAIETDALWTLVGGAEGLRRMAANADILLALAAYTERWNHDEGIIVTERMRRDAIALRRATGRLRWALALGYGSVSGPFHVQEAASAYYLMRQRLLALYETSHAGRCNALAAVL